MNKKYLYITLFLIANGVLAMEQLTPISHATKSDMQHKAATQLASASTSKTLFQHFGIPSNTVSDIQKLLVAHIVGPGGWYYKHATCTHKSELSVFDINAQGTLLATTCADNNKVNVWRTDTGTLSRVYEHTDKVNNAMFGPDGHTLLISLFNKRAMFWSLEGTNAEPQAWGDNVYDIAVIPTKNKARRIAKILWQDNASSVCIYDANRNFITWFSHGNYLVYDILFHAQGEVVATNATNDIISLWSLKERKMLWQKELGSINRMVFHKKESILAVASRKLQLFDFKGTLLDVIEKTNNQSMGFDFHPTRCIFATTYHDNMVYVWQYNGDFTKRNLLHFLKHADEVQQIVFNPQGTMLATTLHKGNVCLWSMDGVILHTLPHDRLVWGPQFPDENKLVVANDNAINIWHKHKKPTLKQVLLRLVLYQYYKDCDKKNEKPEICATHDLIPEWMAQKFALKKDELLNIWDSMPESLRKSIFNTLVFREKSIKQQALKQAKNI